MNLINTNFIDKLAGKERNVIDCRRSLETCVNWIPANLCRIWICCSFNRIDRSVTVVYDMNAIYINTDHCCWNILMYCYRTLIVKSNNWPFTKNPPLRLRDNIYLVYFLYACGFAWTFFCYDRLFLQFLESRVSSVNLHSFANSRFCHECMDSWFSCRTFMFYVPSRSLAIYSFFWINLGRRNHLDCGMRFFWHTIILENNH